MPTDDLRVDDRATFRGCDGRLVSGRVYTVVPGRLYLVIGDDRPCATYEDGLYRFRDQDIVKPARTGRLGGSHGCNR